MNDDDLHLAVIYTDAFTNRAEWTQEDHMKGLRAVFAAGAAAQSKAVAAVPGETGKA